jgi:uncharacterized membrane protein YgaE (UPF0421/DUF939 family)
LLTMGPRIIKTGLAITLALSICSWLQLEPAIFAGVAAVSSVQPSIYRTWRHSWDQLQTNTLGAVIALLAVYIVGNHPIVIGLVSILVIMISLRMRMEATIPLTLVTVLVIMEAPQHDWHFALTRFAIILIGTGSALLVNVTLWPPNQEKLFLERVRSAFGHMSLLLRTAISNEMTEAAFKRQREMFHKELDRLDNLYGIFDEERRKLARLRITDVRRLVVFKQMLHTLHKGKEVLEIVEGHYTQSTDDERVNEVFDHQLEQLIKHHEYILLKYEGVMKRNEGEEFDILRENGLFMNRVMELYKGTEEPLRLVLVGSSVFDYGFQLHRLERLVEHWLGKAK